MPRAACDCHFEELSLLHFDANRHIVLSTAPPVSAGSRLFTCTGLAGAEMDGTKRRERKARQLKKQWKIKFHESPDLRLCGPRKRTHAKTYFKKDTNLLQNHPFPSEPWSLTLTEEPFITGMIYPRHEKESTGRRKSTASS